MLAFYWQGVATWNTQYKPSYATYSPGRLMLVSFAEQRFNEGCRELDFMRGEERYKFDWTSHFQTNLALRSGPIAVKTTRSPAKLKPTPQVERADMREKGSVVICVRKSW